jgi:hypothetical protein
MSCKKADRFTNVERYGFLIRLCYYIINDAKKRYMIQRRTRIFLKEAIWFIGILCVAAFVEFLFIELMNLHPVLSIKIQGLVGLMLVGYFVRMCIRIWKTFHKPSNPTTNGQQSLD